MRALLACCAFVLLISCTKDIDGVSRSEPARDGPGAARRGHPPAPAPVAPVPSPPAPTPADPHGLAQVTYLKASSTQAGATFGHGLALSEDTLVVGANAEDGTASGPGGNPAGAPTENSGAVHVFRRVGDSWQQEARLEASRPQAHAGFGCSVAISGDTLAVGAMGANRSSGAVHVYRRTGSSWTEEAYLDPSLYGDGGLFGMNVALSGDLLAVSAPMDASTATGIDGHRGHGALWSGAVYVFRRSGSSWVLDAYIKASNASAGDRFGYGLALSGNTLAVGAYWEGSAARGIDGDQSNDDAPYSGAVYVFRRAGSVWVQEAYIKASNAETRDSFGLNVALSGDTLAVGAHTEHSSARGVGGDQSSNDLQASGAAYVFRRTGSSWAQEAYIKASNTGAGDFFGMQVALSGDILAVGAMNERSAATGVNGDQADDSARRSGAVYMFRRTGSSWAQTAYLKASNTGAGDEFSNEIALSPGMLAVSAPHEDSAATGVNGNQHDESAADSGAVYLFRLPR